MTDAELTSSAMEAAHSAGVSLRGTVPS
jgi:hypothetical protein